MSPECGSGAKADGLGPDDLSAVTLRAGTGFDLVLFDRLPVGEQALFAELRRDSAFYGILRPVPGSGRTVKAVDKETALLWFTLQTPGLWPSFASARSGNETWLTLCRLLLDGVVEIKWGDRFLTGTEAATVLRPVNGERAPSRGRLATLSRSALQFGEALRLPWAEQLATRLYGFGRQPLTRLWSQRLRDRDAVLAFVGAGPETTLGTMLRAYFQPVMSPSNTGWIHWSPRAEPKSHSDELRYKLYVSPSTEEIPRVFPQVVEIAAKQQAPFKIGADAAGLLRPDKIVLYFPTIENLFAAATELTGRLDRVAAQGVPFSAEITADGQLSWGMDPPSTEKVVSWLGAESWRLWVVRRLAAAMIAAQNDHAANISAAEFALERLRLEGVDVDAWTPSAAIWAHGQEEF